MPRVKICGCTDESDVRAAVAAGADAVGVIGDVPVDTPRAVSSERATDLLAAVPPFVTATLVTMPETPERAVSLVETVAPDAVQLHGDLPRGDLAYVASKLEVPLLGSVDAAAPERAAAVADVVDGVVVDSLDESGAGGTGRTHNWTRTREATRDLPVPVVLAGGLTPENVGAAVAAVDPFAVDVASGVERIDPSDGPGRKDASAVERFVARMKGHPEASPEATP
jgi:phosphoribosylanthranilate isomerase